MTIPVDPLAPPSPSARTLRLRIRPHLLPGVALLAILVIGLLSSLSAFYFKSSDLPAKDKTWPALASGDTTSAVSRFLQKANPFADALVSADRIVSWLAVGDLGDRVRRGCDNWLFLTDELVTHPDRTSNLTRHLKIVEAAAAFLKRRNIALAVVPVPDKSRVEAAALCGLGRPAMLAGRLADFTAALRGDDIDVVDVLAPMAALSGERYYRTDTHWNERGAKAAADAIAAHLRQDGLAPSQKAEFRVSIDTPRERVGDLIRLAGLDRVPYPLRPRGDVEAPTVIEQSALASVGLLDEVPSPQTALLGTSFSRRANFVPFLALALSAPVENEAQDGGGIANAAISYFAKPEFTKSPPRVIVWEIPERMLEEPVAASDEAWSEGLSR
jgi:alginate O-acetyltransferase complex protein AlgJ